MLKKFSVITLVMFFCQVFLTGINTFIGIFSFITILFFLIVQIRILSKVRLEHSYRAVFIISKCTYVFGLFCCWSLYYFISNYQNQIVTSLSTLRDLGNVGIYYKMNTVIIPALAYLLIKTVMKSKKSKFVILSLTFACCSAASVFTLSKAPIISFFILILGIFNLRWYVYGIGTALSILILSVIYKFRGQSEDIGEVLELVIYRFPLFIELQDTFNYLGERLFIDYTQLERFSAYVTEDVFGRDSRYVGIAPGTPSSFILIFSVFSPFAFVLILEGIKNLINTLSKKNQIGFIAASLISFEIFHSLIDGLPHFYTSTNNGLFFWGILGLTLISFIYGKERA